MLSRRARGALDRSYLCTVEQSCFPTEADRAGGSVSLSFGRSLAKRQQTGSGAKKERRHAIRPFLARGPGRETLLRDRKPRRVKPGVVHRLIGAADVDLIEVSTTELADVVRIADDYGREGTSVP